MADKTSGYSVRLEVWVVLKDNRYQHVPKITIRDKTGRFHGATNFRQKV